MKLELKIPPVVVILIIATAMWWINEYFIFDWTTFGTVWWISFLFLGMGGLFGLLGLIAFYNSSTSIDPHNPHKTSNLVTNGVYSISRNPMYVGLFFILAAYGFYLGNVIVFAMLPLFVGYMNRYQIVPEENVMEEKFGKEYQKYKSEVRRWL